MISISVKPETRSVGSSNNPVQSSADELKSVFSELTGFPVERLDRIRLGRNSSVFKVNCREKAFAGKVYPQESSSSRDRLGVEFSALTFLWKRGVKCIPEPVAADRTTRAAVYEYIVGDRPFIYSLTESDVDSAAAFLGVLKELTKDQEAGSLPLAAEAYFSIASMLDNINRRLKPLSEISESGQAPDALDEYLTDEFEPSLNEIAEWCRSACRQAKINFESEISQDERTLSPSDFGFHNSIRRPDGGITFLDFEYFGWDDPAKTIADFLLHPGMDLSDVLKQRFATRAISMLGDANRLAKRLEIVYPLCGLKWCLILLNEWLPENLGRRRLSAGGPIDLDVVLPEQLSKAKAMLQKIKREYQRFPYHE